MHACTLNSPSTTTTLSLPLHHALLSKPTLQFPQSLSSPSSPSLSLPPVITNHTTFHLVVVPEDSQVISGVSSSSQDFSEGITKDNNIVLERRRKRRQRKRTRRKNADLRSESDDEEEDGRMFRAVDRRRFSKVEKSRYLTRRQEAQFSLYLKVGCSSRYIQAAIVICLLQGLSGFKAAR